MGEEGLIGKNMASSATNMTSCNVTTTARMKPMKGQEQHTTGYKWRGQNFMLKDKMHIIFLLIAWPLDWLHFPRGCQIAVGHWQNLKGTGICIAFPKQQAAAAGCLVVVAFVYVMLMMSGLSVDAFGNLRGPRDGSEFMTK